MFFLGGGVWVVVGRVGIYSGELLLVVFRLVVFEVGKLFLEFVVVFGLLGYLWCVW